MGRSGSPRKLHLQKQRLVLPCFIRDLGWRYTPFNRVSGWPFDYVPVQTLLPRNTRLRCPDI